MPDDLREPIAEVVHDLWASWTRFVLSQCYHTAAGLVIPPLLLDKWTRQAATPYPALPEAEKGVGSTARGRIDSEIQPWIGPTSNP
jgi:hypothetical protein